nr:Chain C, 13-mer peptide: ALA-GLY-ASN-HIS-ALA-ALA-GLY-ILE-LEU-THR-LEU-GLY-LYS [Homo sapiens]
AGNHAAGILTLGK